MTLKKTLIASVALALLFGLAGYACAQEEGGEAPTLETDKQKASYAIGHNLGSNFDSQGVDIDLEVLIAGLRAGLAGEEPPLPAEELQAAVQALQQEVMAAQQARTQAEAAENQAAGQEFLAENAQKEGVQVTDSGLQYEVVEPGVGESPEAQDQVQIHYTGTLIDGTKFDSSHDRGQPATFPVSGVIAGFAEGLQLMKEGGKYKLYIPPDIGYGERASGPIPPNSTLIFDIELLGVIPADAGQEAGEEGGDEAETEGGGEG